MVLFNTPSFMVSGFSSFAPEGSVWPFLLIYPFRKFCDDSVQRARFRGPFPLRHDAWKFKTQHVFDTSHPGNPELEPLWMQLFGLTKVG